MDARSTSVPLPAMPAPTPATVAAAGSPAPVVLVTGGAKRLGAEFVRAFAARGWRVLVHHGRSAAEAQALVAELRQAGTPADTLAADLARPEEVATLVPRAAAVFGRLDALINNASLFEPDTGLDPDPALLAQQQQVNLNAPLLLTAALARHCRDRGVTGAAIHVLDQKVHNLNPDYFSYTIGKLALAQAVRLQAQSLAPHLRVNGVLPGLLYLSGPQTPENFAWAGRQNLLGRPIEPADVARAAADLVANPAVTGALLNVDNGQHLLPQARDVMFLSPDDAGAAGAPA